MKNLACMLIFAGCGATSWDVCETEFDGRAACVENGSTYQQSGAGFDECAEDQGKTPADGTCAELGYGCAAPDADPGLFFLDEDCG